MIIVVEERSWNAIERALSIVWRAMKAFNLSRLDEHTYRFYIGTFRRCGSNISPLRPRVERRILMINIVNNSLFAYRIS
jgi:hypothetical protein